MTDSLHERIEQLATKIAALWVRETEAVLERIEGGGVGTFKPADIDQLRALLRMRKEILPIVPATQAPQTGLGSHVDGLMERLHQRAGAA